MSKIVIAGSRDLEDKELVFSGINRALNLMKTWPTEVFSGKCPTGADKFGELWAHEHNIFIKPFPAAWKTMGKAAGPIRNAQMAMFCDKGIVFINNDSKGSVGMAALLQRHQKPNVVFKMKDQKIVATYLNGAYTDDNNVVNNTIFFE